MPQGALVFSEPQRADASCRCRETGDVRRREWLYEAVAVLPVLKIQWRLWRPFGRVTLLALEIKCIMDILESEHLQALRKAIQEGIDSGPGLPANEVFDRLEKKYLALAEKKQ